LVERAGPVHHYQAQGVAVNPQQRLRIVYQMQQMIYTARPYIVLTNDVRSKRDELARVTQQVSATQSQVAALKPYADLDQLRQSLLQQVRTVAGSRYDWPTMLNRIARAFPSDAQLTSFNGNEDGSSGSGPSVTPLCEHTTYSEARPG